MPPAAFEGVQLRATAISGCREQGPGGERAGMHRGVLVGVVLVDTETLPRVSPHDGEG